MKSELLIDVGIVMPDEAPQRMAAHLFLPGELQRPAVVLFCVPGGGHNHRYFDLVIPGEDGAPHDITFSFARRMAERGFVVVIFDPLATGASTRPEAGYDLHPDILAEATGRAIAELQKRFHAGTVSPDLPALPDFVSIGVGHSLGALTILLQQDRTGSHRAIALLGFATRGSPENLPAEDQHLAHNPERARAELSDLTRKRFPETPYPFIKTGGRGAQIYGGGAEKRVMAVMRQIPDNLLAASGMFAVIPGSAAPEAARVEVPVLIVVGDKDMTGPVDELAPPFARSPKVEVVELPDTGHSHFAFASIDQLIDQVATWARAQAG